MWVFAGALTKTFVGLPGDLPAPILQMDFDPLVVLVIAVAVETAIGLLAILAPRRGWIPITALLCVFASVLILHMRTGAESCGCFGGALLIPPALMLGIDAALLAGVLATSLIATPTAPWKFPTNIPPQVLLRPTQWIGKPGASLSMNFQRDFVWNFLLR